MLKLIIITTLLALSSPAASDTILQCPTDKDVQIKAVPEMILSLMNVALGTSFKDDEQRIVWYDDSLEYAPKEFMAFVIFHECAHHELKHHDMAFEQKDKAAIVKSNSRRQYEDDADCLSVKNLVTELDYRQEQIGIVIESMRYALDHAKLGDANHDTVTHRSNNMLACAAFPQSLKNLR